MHRPHRPSSRHSTSRSRTGLLILLCIAQLMVILDISAVNVALPDMAKDLEISGGDIGWTITSYSLIFGSLLLLGGRAADLLGRRRVFLTGLGVFTLASLASALAGGAATLFAARAGQGLGAAMLSPAALSIIMAAFTQGGERAKALGAWGAVGGAGAAFGVLLGGTLTELVDWRLIFLVNLPVGVALAAAAVKTVPADSLRPRWRGLDVRGALLATLSLGSLVFAASQADSAGWASTQTLGLGAAALVGLAAFAALELRTAQPLLVVQRLADRGVGGGSLMMLAVSAVLFGTFLLSSLYMQNVLGTGPLESGLAFLPMAAAIAVGVHLGTHVISHAGVRVPLAAALAVTAAGMLLLTGVDAGGQLHHRPAPRHADRRRRPRRRARRRLRLGAHRRRGGGDRDALRAQHHRPRDRRLARHRRARHDRDRVAGRAGLRRRATAHRRRLPGRRRPGRRRQRPRACDPALRRQLPPEAPALTARLRPLTTMPATRPPRRADAQRSFDSILDGALDALASDPEASMAEIARRAGVVRATIYVHFPTREALIAAVTERAVAEVTEAIEAAEPTRGEARDALERVVAAAWSNLGRFHALVEVNTRLPQADLRAMHQPVLAVLQPLIERGQRDGAFRAGVPAMWHLSMLLALVHAASGELSAGRIPAAQVEPALLASVLGAVSAR